MVTKKSWVDMPCKIEVKCKLCGEKIVGFTRQLHRQLEDHLESKHPNEYTISEMQDEDYYKEEEKLRKKYAKRDKLLWFNYYDAVKKLREEKGWLF